jgi:hypothetical protein
MQEQKHEKFSLAEVTGTAEEKRIQVSGFSFLTPDS